MHAAWLLALWLLGPGPPIHLWPLAVYLLLQAGRIWVIWTLGDRWTTLKRHRELGQRGI